MRRSRASIIIVACKYRYNIPKREKRERKRERSPPNERTNERTAQLREIELLPIDPGQRVIN